MASGEWLDNTDIDIPSQKKSFIFKPEGKFEVKKAFLLRTGNVVECQERLQRDVSTCDDAKPSQFLDKIEVVIRPKIVDKSLFILILDLERRIILLSMWKKSFL